MINISYKSRRLSYSMELEMAYPDGTGVTIPMDRRRWYWSSTTWVLVQPIYPKAWLQSRTVILEGSQAVG